MRNEFLLWNNASRGLPRNGLVALYDPYRDTYGRNVLPVGADDFSVAHGWTTYGGATVTVTPGQADPDGGTNAYRIQSSGGSSDLKYRMMARPMAGIQVWNSLWIKSNSGGGEILKLATDSAQYILGGSVTITPTTEWGFYSRGCGASTEYKGLVYIAAASAEADIDVTVYHPQMNLGSTLFPYSAPAGEPGTLQTSLDYSGNGNHLTLGADTNASTDDPAFTGTAWSFDGGDYLGMPAQAVGDITVYTVFKVNASLTGSYPGLWGRKNIDAYWEKSTSKVCVDVVTGSGLKTVGTASALTKDVWYLHTARCTVAGLCSSSVTPIPSSIATIGAAMGDGAVSAGSAVGRIEASYGMEGLIAYLAMYNVCHSDSIVATVHRMITGKMALRGIAL